MTCVFEGPPCGGWRAAPGGPGCWMTQSLRSAETSHPSQLFALEFSLVVLPPQWWSSSARQAIVWQMLGGREGAHSASCRGLKLLQRRRAGKQRQPNTECCEQKNTALLRHTHETSSVYCVVGCADVLHTDLPRALPAYPENLPQCQRIARRLRRGRKRRSTRGLRIHAGQQAIAVSYYSRAPSSTLLTAAKCTLYYDSCVLAKHGLSCLGSALPLLLLFHHPPDRIVKTTALPMRQNRRRKHKARAQLKRQDRVPWAGERQQ